MNKKEKKNRIMKLNEKIRMKLDAAVSNGSDEFRKYENKLFWKSRKFNQHSNHHLDFTLTNIDTWEELSLLADIKEEEYGESLTNEYRVEPFNSYTWREFTFSVSEQRNKSFLSNDTILFIVFGIIKYDRSRPRINYIQAIGMNGTYNFRASEVFNFNQRHKKRLLQIEQNIIRKIQELGYKNL